MKTVILQVPPQTTSAVSNKLLPQQNVNYQPATTHLYPAHDQLGHLKVPGRPNWILTWTLKCLQHSSSSSAHPTLLFLCSCPVTLRTNSVWFRNAPHTHALSTEQRHPEETHVKHNNGQCHRSFWTHLQHLSLALTHTHIHAHTHLSLPTQFNGQLKQMLKSEFENQSMSFFLTWLWIWPFSPTSDSSFFHHAVFECFV